MHRQIITSICVFVIAAPGIAAAKNDPAKEKAEANAELAKIAARVEASRKANAGKIAPGECKGLAKDFASFGKSYKLPEGYFNAGVVYSECGDLKEAESSYKDALDLKMDYAPAIVNMGELFFRRGDADGAGQYFDRANKADPKNAQAYAGQAMMLYEKAKAANDPAIYKEAVNKLRRALALDADSVAAYSLLALIYFNVAENDRSKLDLAALVCKQAIEVNDKYPQIYNTLGLIKLKKANVTGALSEFRKAAELEPKYVEAQLNIGAITLSARDYKNAETAFRATVEAKPTPQQAFEATLGLAVALRGQRRVDEAEQWYTKARQLDAKSCAISYNLGLLFQDYKAGSEGDLNKAKTMFNDFVTCGRADADKLKDANRRIKDIDDTFKAMAEAKKLEEENKKIQEEMERMQKEQQGQPQPGQPAPAAPGAAPAAPGAAAPAEKK